MIRISSLSKAFGDNRLFDHLSFTLSPGFYCLTGPSGCGKTTLGRLLIGLEKPDQGTVTGIIGNPVVLFQEPRLLPTLSALQNVACPSNRKEATRDAADLLGQLGFDDDDINKKPSELSGGMKQRVAIARALLFAAEHPGNFALLDEPFRGLDPAIKQTTAALLRDALAGRSVLVITHDEEDIQLLNGIRLTFYQMQDGIC